MIFLTNQINHYFVVICPIDVTKLVGCKTHATLDDMYKHVMSETNLDLDEVDGGEITISKDKIEFDGGWRSNNEVIEDVESYLNDFEM